jgi:hypothetical protein
LGFSGFPKFSVGVTKRKKNRALIIFNGIATYTEADQKNKLLLFVFGLNILSYFCLKLGILEAPGMDFIEENISVSGIIQVINVLELHKFINFKAWSTLFSCT